MFPTFPWEPRTVVVYFHFTASHLIVACFSKGYLWVLCKSCVLCWHSPITSFPHRLCLCYNRFVVMVVVVVVWGWGNVFHSHLWQCFRPDLPHYPSIPRVWNSCGVLSVDVAEIVISRSLMNITPPLPTDQNWKPAGLPGHHQRGGLGRDVRHHRALCAVQVRHPHPEDWQQLQGLHVRVFKLECIINVKRSRL